VWVLFKTVVQERKHREFDPTISVLRECLESPEILNEDAESQRRVKEALGFMENLSAWGEQMLKLEPSCLMKLMKLGSKIKGVLDKI
jgi:DNA-binding transcriptional regulator GbsR (MarR family)